MKKPKTYKYYASMTWVDKDGEFSMMTQLYQVGLYVALYTKGSHMPDQISSDPSRFSRQQAKHIKAMDKAGTKYTLGRQVEAYKDKGLWKEYVEQEPTPTQDDVRDVSLSEGESVCPPEIGPDRVGPHD